MKMKYIQFVIKLVGMDQIVQICFQVYIFFPVSSKTFNVFFYFLENLQGIPEDRLVGPFLTINPELCVIIEDSMSKIVGYACAAVDAKIFYKNQEVSIFNLCLLKTSNC